MTETLPPRPAPIPPPDRSQIERLNALYDFAAAGPPGGWRSRLSDRLRTFLARILFRQREFNAALVEHLNRNAVVGIEAHDASARTVAWVEEAVQTALDRCEAQADETRRHQETLAAWERRTNQTMTSLAAAHEELRRSIAVLRQTAQHVKREVARLSETGANTGFTLPGSAPVPLPLPLPRPTR